MKNIKRILTLVITAAMLATSVTASEGIVAGSTRAVIPPDEPNGVICPECGGRAFKVAYEYCNVYDTERYECQLHADCGGDCYIQFFYAKRMKKYVCSGCGIEAYSKALYDVGHDEYYFHSLEGIMYPICRMTNNALEMAGK